MKPPQWALNTCFINHRFSQQEQTLRYYITGLGQRNFSVALVAVERELECFEEIDFLTCIKKLTLSGELR